MASPAERYAAARRRSAREASPAGKFEANLPFELDDFQREAIDAVAQGAGVLVAAPTGSGKTIVGSSLSTWPCGLVAKPSTRRRLRPSRIRSTTISSRCTAPTTSAC
nr:DEAD/DEAH box helicase [Ornithinimicrobium sp. INDO-MA30-4]